jgi:hypothetical protein
MVCSVFVCDRIRSAVLRKLAYTLQPHHTYTAYALMHYTCTTHALHTQAFCVVMHKLAQLLRPQGVDGLEMCNEEAREHG